MTIRTSRPRFSLAIALMAVTCCVLQATSAQGQDANLRWKFSEGDTYQAQSQQTTSIDTRVEKRTSRITLDVALTSDWKVISSDESSAKIKQSIQAIQLSVDNPANVTKSISIDTQSKQRPARAARKLADQLKGLVGMSLTFSISDRGEISNVETPASLKEQLEAMPEDSPVRSAFSPAQLEATLKGTTVLLPQAKIETGQTWTLASSKNDQLGKIVGQRTATYAGPKSVDGKELEQIDLSLEKKAETEPTGGLRGFEWSGKYWFDSKDGHCARSERTSNITTSKIHREMEIETQVIVNSVFQLSAQPR